MQFCVRDGSGALFCETFLSRKKKRERTARPGVFTEGHVQNIDENIKNKARVILEHSSPIVELKF